MYSPHSTNDHRKGRYSHYGANFRLSEEIRYKWGYTEQKQIDDNTGYDIKIEYTTYIYMRCILLLYQCHRKTTIDKYLDKACQYCRYRNKPILGW